MLDLDEDDKSVRHEVNALPNDALEQYRGLEGQQERPTGMVSGEFYHGTSALHCLQHLISLATTGIIINFCFIYDLLSLYIMFSFFVFIFSILLFDLTPRKT